MKLDLGCGGRKKEGFIGVDQYAMEGVDVVLNIGVDPWPWEDGTVEDSPTFIATYSALFQTVLRLYAIETCLKLIPFINFLYLLNNHF